MTRKIEVEEMTDAELMHQRTLYFNTGLAFAVIAAVFVAQGFILFLQGFMSLLACYYFTSCSSNYYKEIKFRALRRKYGSK